MKKKTWMMVREEDFAQVKLLQQAGVPQPMAKKITGRSEMTINRIYRSGTLADYRTLTRAAKKTAAEQVLDTPPAQETPDGVLQSIDANLRSINARLKFIEDHMPIDTKKRRFQW